LGCEPLCSLRFELSSLNLLSRQVTILEAIQRSADFLAKRAVASPRLQVELLLAHVLKMPRMNLYLNFERVLTVTETETLRAVVLRRGQREPLQYITGSTSFCGLEITVNPHVLIPRPETELLAERAWKFLLQLTTGAPVRALDFGTGSGCLSVAIAVNTPQAGVDAVDISQEALQVARQNAGVHQVASRIQFHHGDGFAALPAGRSFDLIVSNPPYIPAAEIESLEPEVRNHEPRGALDGGPDGLAFYRQLASGAGGFLQPHGRLMLELNDHGAESVREILVKENWTIDAVEPDYNQCPRILIAHRAPELHDGPAKIEGA
jgi:release factor glutamine methyltransferase